MVKDYFGHPLSVGDCVIHIRRTESSAFFEKAVVVGFVGGNSRPRAELRTASKWHEKIIREWGDKIIKIEGGKYENSCFLRRNTKR